MLRPDDKANEFLDMEIEVAADSGASEHVAADTDAPTYKSRSPLGAVRASTLFELEATKWPTAAR